MDDIQIVEFLLKFKDLLSTTDWFSASYRVVLWNLDKMLGNVINSLTSGLNQAYKLLKIYDSPEITKLLQDYGIVFFALMSLAVAYLGFQIMRGKKEINKMVSATFFAITLFISIPFLFSQMSSMLLAGKEALPSNKSQSINIMKGNIIDLYEIDKAGWKTKHPKVKNDIKDMTDIDLLDINESIDTGNFLGFNSPLSQKGLSILDKKVTKVDGKYQLADLKSHFFTEDQTYYRYHFNGGIMFFQLLGKALVLGFTIAKTMMLFTELGVLKVLTVGTSLTDLETGQRNKKLLLRIRNAFIIAYLVLLLLYLYDIIMVFVSNSDMNVFMKSFAIIVISIFFMDGPDVIEEIFGMDAGLKSVGRSLIGFAMGAKGASEMAKGAGGLVKDAAKTSKKVGGKAASTAGSIGGAFKGALDGFSERKAGGKSSNKEPSGNPSPGPSGQPPGGNGGPTGSPPGSSNPSTGNQSGQGSTGSGSGVGAGAGVSAGGSGEMTPASTETPLANYQSNPPQSQAEKNAKNVEGNQKSFAKRPPGNNASGILSGERVKRTGPQLNYDSMSQGAKSARQNMMEYAKGREADPQSMGDKILGAYANTAQRAYDSKPSQHTRKAYDVAKNTTKGKSN